MEYSQSVARKNYLQIIDDHYERANEMVQNQVQKVSEANENKVD